MDPDSDSMDSKMNRRKQQNPKHHSHPGKAGKMQSRAEKETAPGETTSPTAPAVLLSNTTDVKSPTGLDTVDGCSVGEIPKVSPDAAVKEEPAAQKDLVEAPRLVLSMKGKVRKNSLKGKPKPDPDTLTDHSSVDRDPSKSTRKYQCDACGRLLSTSTSLERHMLTHTGQRPFPCPICPICFTTNGNLIRHLKSCHEVNSETSMASPQSLIHLHSTVKREEPKTVEKPETGMNLSGHIPVSKKLSVVEEIHEKRAGSQGSEGEMGEESKYKPFLCTLCDKVFSTRTNCERHIRNRHAEKAYSRQELVKMIKFIPKNATDSHALCKYCKKDFISTKMLKHHLRSPYSSCRRKPFACQLCQATFSTRNNCIRHITNLHPDRKSDYKKLIILNTPAPPQNDDDPADLDDDDLSPPTMAILSPGPNVSQYSDALGSTGSGTDRNFTDEPNRGSSEESMSDSYSPENYALFSPESIHSGRTVDGCSAENPLDLTVGPLDLSLKKRTESTRSSPTSWFLKDIVTIPVPVNLELMKGKKGMVSGGSLMDRAVPLSMVLPLKNMSNAEVNSGNGGGGGAREKERAGKRPRPYICQYCGIGFTIRGNMYRHFRHKHPEHVSKRRHKKTDSPTETSAKQMDDILESVAGTSSTVGLLMPTPQPETFSEADDEDDADMSEDNGPVYKIDCPQEPEGRTLDIEMEGPSAGDLDREKDHDELSSNTSESKHRINSYSMSPHVHACNECGRKFPWQSSLERHMYTHTGQKPYSCRWCPLKFSIKSNCERHCLRIHGKSFNNPRKERRNQGKPFKCPICEECFSFKINCERHCLDVHKQHYEAIALDTEAIPEGEMQSLLAKPLKGGRRVKKGDLGGMKPSFYYQCLDCDASFEVKKDLEVHEENNHPLDEGTDVVMEGHEDTNSSFSGSLVVDA